MEHSKRFYFLFWSLSYWKKIDNLWKHKHFRRKVSHSYKSVRLTFYSRPWPFCTIFWGSYLSCRTFIFEESKPYKDMGSSTFFDIFSASKSEWMRENGDYISSIDFLFWLLYAERNFSLQESRYFSSTFHQVLKGWKALIEKKLLY